MPLYNPPQTPLSVTTKGDLQTHNGTAPARLAVGSNGQVLSALSSETNGLKWVTPVTEDSTTTFTNKDLTSETNTFANIVYTNSLARQALINGNFDIWQRGTSVAMTAANAYTADRWYCETATAGTDKTVSQEDGTGVNGSKYCARVKMVSDVDELLTFSQALESQDSIKFRGKKLTLSFYARGGTEFVADNATLVSKIVTGKGTDQKVLAFTTLADGVSQNNTLTTSWQKFTCTTTSAIASDITQIGVSFSFTHAGAGTTTNYFEITQVQLCAGDVALPFMPKSYEEELRACMRYYETGGYGGITWWYHAISTVQFYNHGITFYKVTKRTIYPVVTMYGYSSNTANSVDVEFTSTAKGVSHTYKNENMFMVEPTSASLSNNTGYIAYWKADAEL